MTPPPIIIIPLFFKNKADPFNNFISNATSIFGFSFFYKYLLYIKCPIKPSVIAGA